MSANYGLFSGFASKVDYYSNKFKLDDIEDVLEEAPEKLADSVILFCQVSFLPVIAFLIALLPGSWLDADSQAKVFSECEHLQSG